MRCSRALLQRLLLGILVANAAGQVLLSGRQVGVMTTPEPAGDRAPLEAIGQGKVQLRLCECERAAGEPDGLSCEREGWFVSSFERQGQWMVGGGFVPLSHAVCCRPCLPDEVPADPSGRIPPGEAPLAVVSLGCHPSTDSQALRCEGNAGSFVSGFGEDLRVFAQPDTFYPINSVHCCTPALLLASGDAWELERCDCHDSADATSPVGCGGTATDELLFGFIDYRLSPVGSIVPVGPAQCCKVCLSERVHPMSECDDRNACSGHGVCALAQCQCLRGWAGADCGRRVAGGRGDVPPWGIALIVVSSCALASMLVLIGGHVLQAIQSAQSGGEGDAESDDPARQPLLLRIDAGDCGSVGSADTSDGEEEEMADVEARIDRVAHRLEQIQASEEAAEAAEAGQAGPESAGVAEAGAEAEAPPGDAASAASPEPGASASDAAAAPAGACELSAEKEDALCALHHDPATPLVGRDCAVCMVRPVQVVTIPCGHAAMCRRCSRRLKRCPMCRKDVVRRQRLFV